MAKPFCTFIIFIFCGLIVKAQTTTVFEENKPHSVEIKANEKQSKSINNKILNIIASSVGKPVGQTILSYQMKEYDQITRNGGKLTVSVEIGNFVLAGDYKYKGFSINSYLLPELINIACQFSNTEANLSENKEFKSLKLIMGKPLVKFNQNDTLRSGLYKIGLTNISLDFSENDFKKLDDYVALIDDYYNADAHLLIIESELEKIRTDTLELLETFRQQTIDNVGAINKIKAERYQSKLDLDSYDPVGLVPHLGKTEQKNKDIKKQVEYTLSNMHEAYYFKGMDWLNWNNPLKAAGLFKKSVQVKPLYAPPHYQLALMDFDLKKYQPVLDTCAKINGKMKPDTDTRYNTVRLAEKVITIYIDSVKGFIARNGFDEGFRLLESTIAWSKKIEGVKTFAEFDELYAILYRNVYQKLINEAKIKIESNDLDGCHILADSAGQLRQTHTQFYIDATPENEVMNLLYQAWVAQGKKALEESKPDAALYAFDKATEICKKYSAVECSQELNNLAFQCHSDKYQQLLEALPPVLSEAYADSALALLESAEKYRLKWELKQLPQAEKYYLQAYQIKYDGLINEGDRAYKQQKAREALAFYKSAMEISKRVKIQPNAEWELKNKNATKLFIIQTCEQGISFAELLQIGKAGQLYQLASDMATGNKLAEDGEVKKALDELAAALDQGECSKAWHEYNIEIGSANRLIEQKEFLKANGVLDKAMRIARLNFKCNLIDTAASRRMNDIAAICKYEKLMNKINPTLEQKGFAQAIDYYLAATDFFSDSCSNKFGITHKLPFDFIFTSQYTGLIESGVKYYTRQGDPAKALKLLDELYRRNYEPMWAKECQTELGAQLARYDYQANPNIDAKLKVLDYTRGDKWYNNLKKAYLQEWKNH
jgi:hypothetical protein